MGKYIISDPKILGGKAVISSTRIPVDQIPFLLNDDLQRYGDLLHIQRADVCYRSTRCISGGFTKTDI